MNTEAHVKRKIPKEYLGAFREGHRVTSKDFIDHDYTRELLRRAQLGDEECKRALEFLTKFNNEEYKGVFKCDGSDFENDHDKHLEKWNEGYSRRMDAMNRTSEAELSHESFPEEDLVLAIIDLKREKKNSRPQ